MKNIKVLISGVTGQIGSYMVEHLLETTDYEIVGCVRRTSQFIDSNIAEYLKNDRFKIVHFDLNDVHSVTTTIRNEQPDYFLNFGAQTFVADSWHSPVSHMTTNAIGVLHILEAVKNDCPKCKVYSSGSSEQFGNVEYSPQDENHPMKPRSPYGVSKCAAGLMCKTYRESYGMYVVHGFVFNNESARRQKYFVTRKITSQLAAISLNKTLPSLKLGNLDAKRDWSHSRDVVKVVWLMMQRETPKDYVIASGVAHSVRDFVDATLESLKIKGRWEGQGIEEKFIEEGTGRVLVEVSKDYYRPADVELLLGDASKAREELGWKPEISFKNLVDRMVKKDMLLLKEHESRTYFSF